MAQLKLKAATLVESMISLVVIMICTGITMMIYVNVIRSDNTLLKLQAMCLLKDELIEMKKTETYISGEETVGKFRVVKNVEPYSASDKLYKIELWCLGSSDDTLYVCKELVFIGEE